jgi:hypothetical protein
MSRNEISTSLLYSKKYMFNLLLTTLSIAGIAERRCMSMEDRWNVTDWGKST